MPKTIRYIGTQNYWPEVAYTGRPTRWMPGMADECPDNVANALLATGLFRGVLQSVYLDSVTRQAVDAAGNAIGGGAPIVISGVPAVGNTLTANISPGWRNSGGNWTRDGANISGATALTYPLVSADNDKDVTYASSNIPYTPPAVRIGAAMPVAPGAPTIGTATAGDGVVNVVFTAPASTGGSPILEFQAELSNANSATGAGSPIPVASANGAAVTGRVRARNAVDWGPWSANSNSVTPSAGATVPGQPAAPTATAGDGTVSLAFVAPSTGGSPILEYGALLSNGNTNTGNPTGSPVSVASANGAAVTGQIRARNAIGWGPYSPASNAVTPSAVGEPISTFAANASQGQWVRENIVQNTRDRATAGDYAMIGLATNNGYFQVVKRFADGTFSAPVTLNPAPNGPAEPDDHNVPALLQLPSGRWLAVWNRHGIAGATGFRYAITASPHGLDFGALVVVAGSATWNGGTAASTYTQVYMVGNRVIIFYRVGGSQNGAWVARYSDNIGATTPAWSAEVLVTPTAYMDSAIAPDGVTLRCAMYDHPYNTLGHDIFTFDVNLSTGDMIAAGSSAVIGNIFTNTVPVENTATRKAVAISSGTSRLFNIDAAGNLYGMEMAGGNGSQTWPSGTYYRYVRTAGTGAYTKQAVSETGLPFLGGQQGYYGSICRLDDDRVLVSVNTGAGIGLGSWELREYVTANGGGSWTPATVHTQGSAIIMRPQALNNLMFWYEATAYASYTSFTASGKFRLSQTAVFTPRPSVPAGTDPAPVVPVAPTITAGPASAAVTEGANATFNLTITGTYDAVQWQTQDSGSSTWVDHADADNNTSVTIPAAPLSYNGMKVRARAGNQGAFSSWTAQATLTVTAAAGDGFSAVAVNTLTNLTDLGSNRFAATSAAGSQGAILYTGQKKPAGAAAVARLYYTASDASGIVAVGNSTVPTAAASACPRVMQISVAGLLSTVNSGGTSQQTGFQFTAPGAGCWAELRCDAAGMWTVRATQDGGASWSADFPCISSGGTNAPYDVETYLRYYTSYAASGTVPRERVIDNPRQQGFSV